MIHHCYYAFFSHRIWNENISSLVRAWKLHIRILRADRWYQNIFQQNEDKQYWCCFRAWYTKWKSECYNAECTLHSAQLAVMRHERTMPFDWIWFSFSIIIGSAGMHSWSSPCEMFLIETKNYLSTDILRVINAALIFCKIQYYYILFGNGRCSVRISYIPHATTWTISAIYR